MLRVVLCERGRTCGGGIVSCLVQIHGWNFVAYLHRYSYLGIYLYYKKVTGLRRQ